MNFICLLLFRGLFCFPSNMHNAAVVPANTDTLEPVHILYPLFHYSLIADTWVTPL